MSTRVGCLVRISGRVQGVFFRAWTKQQAEQLGVAGWVRNCQDGSVEAQLAGEAKQIEGMIERLRQGPPQARVDAVQVNEALPDSGISFEIRG